MTNDAPNDQRPSGAAAADSPSSDAYTAHSGDGTNAAHESGSLLKLAVEAGPLLVFFLANSYSEELFGASGNEKIFWATGVFMVATAISLVTSRLLFNRIPIMPLVSGVFVFLFGGLTLWLQDELFIKLKPTIVNLLFATILFTGLLGGRPLLKFLFGDAFRLTEEGWRILTIRWAWFFVFLAVLNEVIWRSFSTDFWAGFKLFGVLPITLIFAAAQIGVLMKHQLGAPERK
ncbi:MAG: septation protein A [Hyphomicrobiaceae bacterium]